jgi:hypothetical protein
MPKKFGINSKAEASREREANAKAAKKVADAKAKEDAKWADTADPKREEKARKAAEEAKKRDELAKKRQEAREQLRQEEAAITGKPTNTKMTLAERQRQRDADKRQADAARERREAEASKIVHLDPDAPIPENLNRTVVHAVDARSLDSALAQFDDNDAITDDNDASTAAASSTASTADDRHPEKRMLAAFKAYEEKHLQRMRDENPSLRLQQVKNMLWEDWQRSPDNPMVQKKHAEKQALAMQKRGD